MRLGIKAQSKEFTIRVLIDDNLPFLDVLTQILMRKSGETTLYGKRMNADIVLHFNRNKPQMQTRHFLGSRRPACTDCFTIIGALVALPNKPK